VPARHDASVKRILIACLFVVACKDKEEAKSAAPAETPPTATTPSARPPRPSLPAQEQPRDWNDPAAREQMRVRREERRKDREQMLDTNKDGTVSPEERRERLRPMMDRMDQNHDGKLTVEELSQVKGRVAFDDPKAIDTDHNGEISITELDTAVTARREEMRQAWQHRREGSAGPD